jgi:hypothetical protein
MAQNPGNEIKIAMLDRFLNGRMRTQDRFVALFHSFAESLMGGIRN